MAQPDPLNVNVPEARPERTPPSAEPQGRFAP
jgi:hypothetical protein